MAMKLERVGDLDLADVGIADAEPGVLYVLREPKHSDRFYGDIETLHVISKAAGGEVRGYVRPIGEREWRLRTPAYPMEWPEVDRATANLLGDRVNGAESEVTRKEV